MPEIRFDGRTVAVPDGTNLVEAGLAAGVPVPVFCYHRDLGGVGACRVCAVTATVDGRGRLVMACMTAAREGMDVTTLDPESVAFRRRVLEWLMIHHPHDCPVCDEGGECQLQDLTVASGHSRRRYRGAKRTFQNQFLGEFIAHEMNRCITCYRCSRFYQDYAGGADFMVAGSRDRVFFGRFEDGPLQSPFSGNLVEVCPTGVFTDRLFRYRSRVWDLEQSPAICPHCSVGCNVLPGSRYRELQRVRVRDNPEVNGVFLCDRGQFGHGWVMDGDRPLTPRVANQPESWDDALGMVGGRLLWMARELGPGTIALVTSPRASLETHAALAALAAGPLAGAHLAHFDDPEREARALAALELLRAAGAAPLEQSDIGRCDALLVAGASLVDEAPLAALAARQAGRNGGLFVVGPVERYLADVAAAVVPAHPARLAAALGEIAGAIASRRPRENGANGPHAALDAAGAALLAAERPGILVGSDLLDGPAFGAVRALAAALGARGRSVRLGALFPGANGFGAALLSRGPSLPALLEALRAGRLHGAVLVECDLADLAPGVADALRRLELLVIADHVRHGIADAAHAALPTLTPYECDGTFVNRAGRVQGFRGSRAAGIPVTAMISDGRFPAEPRHVPPASEARPAWWALERLRAWTMGRPGPRDLEALREALASGPLAKLADATPGAPGVFADLGARGAGAEVPDVPAFEPPHRGFALYRLDRTLGSEPLSRRSAPLMRMAGPPRARIAADGGAPAGSVSRLQVEADGTAIEIEAIHDSTVPRGVLLAPRDALPALAPQGGAVRVRPLAGKEAS